MDYLQITVSTVSEGSELVSMVLYDCGSDGVSIIDDSDIAELIAKKLNWDYVDDNLIKSLNGKAIVSGYFPLDFDVSQVFNALDELKKVSVIPLGSLEVKTEKISSSDWENEWRKYYSPIEVGKVVIVSCLDEKSVRGQSCRVYRAGNGFRYG